jgi:hypothetical protein
MGCDGDLLRLDGRVSSNARSTFVLHRCAGISAFPPHQTRRIDNCVAAIILVAIWWLSILPTNDRDWKPDSLKTAYASINGDQVTIHDIRNCDYCTEEDYTCQWDVHSYSPAKLCGADLFIT